MYGVWQQAASMALERWLGACVPYPKQKAGEEYGINC